MSKKSITGMLTGGLIEPGNSDFYGSMAKNEAQRRGLINIGMKNINAVFSGGTTDIYNPASYTLGGKFDPTKDYYYLNNQSGAPTLGWHGAWSPSFGMQGDTKFGAMTPEKAGYSAVLPGMDPLTGFNPLDPTGMIKDLFGSGESKMEKYSRLAKTAFNANDYFLKDTKSFEGFGPEFFQDRAKAYYDYALPQFNEQYDLNRRQTVYGLANRGLLGSTQGEDAKSKLERTAGTGRQAIVDSAIAQANALKKTVEDSRNQAIMQLYQTADPSMALNTAINAASSARQPSTFAPLANMFSGLAENYLTSQILNNTPNSGGGFNYGGAGDYFAPLGRTSWVGN